jgi:hypothetical protein
MIKVRHATRMIVNERDILACVDHPFITGLQYAFQDDQEVRRSDDRAAALVSWSVGAAVTGLQLCCRSL